MGKLRLICVCRFCAKTFYPLLRWLNRSPLHRTNNVGGTSQWRASSQPASHQATASEQATTKIAYFIRHNNKINL